MITDGAIYTIKTANMLKTVIYDIKHVTCLWHGIHYQCESIRHDCSNGNSLISFLKWVLVKNRDNQFKYVEIVKKKHSRVSSYNKKGTCINFAINIFANFDAICNFIKSPSL